jgi:hypothetical protein
MRGSLGMHYTSVPNILKTLEPLFINDFREDLFKARHSKKQINEFLRRLSTTVIFDSACGSGNFLVIAYRELRKLELQAMDALRDISSGASLSFGFSSVVSLSNFYGIEYADFAAETAKLALWIAEYQQNARFSAAFGANIPALPLNDSANILCANALRVDWDEFCIIKEEQETYIVGNPPYLGVSLMDTAQKEDMEIVFSGEGSNYKSLDYVCAWILKSARFIKNKNSKFALVTTNSITQGIQASTLWPSVFSRDLEIDFAHTSFKWSNNAANNAAVICVIVALRNKSKAHKNLYSNNEVKTVGNINGYLLNAPNIIISKSSNPITKRSKMDYGNKPVDGGHLILSKIEAEAVLKEYPHADKFIRKLVGSQEIIKGITRYCLWITEENATEAMLIKPISSRVEKVRDMRLESTKKQTRESACRAYEFGEVRQVSSDAALIIPSHSSENRKYLPVGHLSNGEIVPNSAFAIYDGSLVAFSLLVSRLHLLWIGTVCGKIKSDFRYSNTMGWNTFPIPELNGTQEELLISSAKRIILIRESHIPMTVSELYKEETFPEDLKNAHEKNDELIESIYRGKPFSDDEERLSYLFEIYLKSVDEVTA